MRRFPKKCKICGEYMEPRFNEVLCQSGMNTFSQSNPNVEPSRWECFNSKCRKYALQNTKEVKGK